MTSLILAGAVTGAAALFVLAGLGKVYRGLRGQSTGSAIATALRMAPERWRWVECGAGVVEAGTGIAALTGFRPALTGVAMALQGALFTSLLAYVRHARIPGECGCVRRARRAEVQVGWGVVARAAVLVAVGALSAAAQPPRAPAWTHDWYAVVAIGIVTFSALLSVEWSMPIRACRRPLWFSTSKAVGELIENRAFAAMVASGGPFTDGYAHRRSGCVDEFWFTVPGEMARPVAFRVDRSGAVTSVNASIAPQVPADATWRRIAVGRRLAAEGHVARE